MGTPEIIVHLNVLFDLKINKKTDSLVQMLTEFPEHARQIALSPANKTSTIRRIMECLLENKAWLGYFHQMLDCLGFRFLLQEEAGQAPHLISRMVELCDEETVLCVYNQLSRLEGIEEEVFSAYVKPFRAAYLSKKYKVIEHLYAKGIQYNVRVDEAVCESHHPLCFAAYFSAMDTQSSLKFAQAYLNAMATRKDRGIQRNSVRYDSLCSDTVLESIAKSGRVDLMELALRYGANVNALSRDGRTLYDISTGEMRIFLQEKGGKTGDRQDYLLMKSFIGVKLQESERLEYIRELMQIEPYHVRLMNTETDILYSSWAVDLLSEAIANCDIEALEILMPAIRKKLYSHQTLVALKQTIKYCIDDIFSVDCAKLARMLRLFDENGIRFAYMVEQRIFVLQAIQDLVFYVRYTNEEDTIIDIAYLLCKLFRSLNPVELYHKALVNVSRTDWNEVIPSIEAVTELFVSRGWKPTERKKR